MENYFNYFTEVEECFRRCRGTPTLLSTLDWALIESWKEAGIPLQAVLLGIQRSFQKFTARPRRSRKVNSVAYCAQEILRAAEEGAAAADRPAGENGARPGSREISAPFSEEEIIGFLERNAEAVEKASRQVEGDSQQVLAEDLVAAAQAVRAIGARKDAPALANLEELERSLTALEEKLTASLTRASSVELLAEFRREVEHGLIPYRRKMNVAQIESLERQFLKKCLFEHYQVPRLSLFYL